MLVYIYYIYYIYNVYIYFIYDVHHRLLFNLLLLFIASVDILDTIIYMCTCNHVCTCTCK